MDKKQLTVLAAILGAVILIVVIIVLLGDTGGGPTDENGDGISLNEDGPPPEWLDAPDPMEDIEEMEQVRNLWPDVFERKPDREEVRRQWAEFAQEHPDNIYIPSQFLPELSDEQKAERRAVLDAVGEMSTEVALQRARARKNADTSQDGPDAPPEPTVDPETQKKYFNYRIQELQSRIELIEYALAKGELDPDQVPEAQKELEEWKAQKKELEEVLAQVP